MAAGDMDTVYCEINSTVHMATMHIKSVWTTVTGEQLYLEKHDNFVVAIIKVRFAVSGTWVPHCTELL